ncbi:histidine kinase dimerization/phosphoacceptor domain-containing protein [Streptomyces sp. M19]
MAALGVLLLPLALWIAPRAVALHGRWTRLLLAPGANAQLTDRIERLTATRSDAVDAGNAEIRRIERDLHDGAQARLVAMGMTLATAAHLVDRDPRPYAPCWRRYGSPPARSWTNCANSCAASTRRCSPTAASATPCARWPWTARCRPRSASTFRDGWTPPSSRPPTSPSRTCSPTRPSGPVCGGYGYVSPTPAACCASRSPTPRPPPNSRRPPAVGPFDGSSPSAPRRRHDPGDARTALRAGAVPVLPAPASV